MCNLLWRTALRAQRNRHQQHTQQPEENSPAYIVQLIHLAPALTTSQNYHFCKQQRRRSAKRKGPGNMPGLFCCSYA
jgi:hypothetical protein